MALKGIKVDGVTHHLDYEYLENKPSMPPAVTSDDEGKILKVNENGEWVAAPISNN